jgi:hypothetical protein
MGSVEMVRPPLSMMLYGLAMALDKRESTSWFETLWACVDVLDLCDNVHHLMSVSRA